jgi:hypothetical protein
MYAHVRVQRDHVELFPVRIVLFQLSAESQTRTRAHYIRLCENSEIIRRSIATRFVLQLIAVSRIIFFYFGPIPVRTNNPIPNIVFGNGFFFLQFLNPVLTLLFCNALYIIFFCVKHYTPK